MRNSALTLRNFAKVLTGYLAKYRKVYAKFRKGIFKHFLTFETFSVIKKKILSPKLRFISNQLRGPSCLLRGPLCNNHL